MARGQVVKEEITKKILETFSGSFIYGKEIRIPMMEDGAEVQVKVALTAAKENVKSGSDTTIPGSVVATAPLSKQVGGNSGQVSVTMTEEEKNNIEYLSQKLKEWGM